MENPIIEVKNLGKKYNINHQQGRYIALRDVLAGIFKNPFQFLKKKTKQIAGIQTTEEYWALKDINFTVNKGEVIGIIGRNGAGKSTLLKILSQITPPTTGEIKIKGRVGSLLEVGTGFHPELTGRENIMLNGAILGMTYKEIAKKFDQIVEFAGIDKFLDTPVKYYSSGMYVRLAFSVAAHMEPDILIIDEVLAVGDAEFQKKCLGKMDEISKKDGKTILFVSHNIEAITRICQRTILLDKGMVMKDGQSQEVANIYLHSEIGITNSKSWPDINKAPGDNIVRLCAVKVKQKNHITDKIEIQLPVEIEMEYEVMESGHILSPNYHFYNEENVCVFVAGDNRKNNNKNNYKKGRHISTAKIPGNLLSEGRLSVGVAISTYNPILVHFYEQGVVSFNVIDNFDGTSARGDYYGIMPGIVRPILQWTNKTISDNI